MARKNAHLLDILEGFCRKKQGAQDSDGNFFSPTIYRWYVSEYNKQLWHFLAEIPSVFENYSFPRHSTTGSPVEITLNT